MSEIVVTAGASPGIVLGFGPTEPRIADFLFGAAGLTSTTTTRYLFPGFADSDARTTPVCRQAPFDGKISRLRVIHNTPGGNGGSITYTVRINGVATALAVTMASTASYGFNLTTAIPIKAGDRIDIEAAKPVDIGAGLSDIIASIVFQM